MVVPETRYARSGDVHIGYQVVGEGPPDLLLVPEFWHSIEAQWDEPALAAFLQRLSSFGRLISFDQRGTGISDPVPPDGVLALEQWLDDLVAVMDEAASKRAVLLGLGGGGSLSMLFAATYPERTRARRHVSKSRMPPRILVLSASVGAGHMRAAQAVELRCASAARRVRTSPF